MAGRRPHYRFVAKSKSSGKYQDIAAFWIGEKGVAGQFDRDIEKIVMKNGQVITGETCWLNLQVTDEVTEEEQVSAPKEEVDETPF